MESTVETYVRAVDRFLELLIEGTYYKRTYPY